jgi:hypothetical protein
LQNVKRRYGRAHRLVRKKYASIVAAGKATCARCDQPILPHEPWDLDHDDEDPLQRRYLGPSHRRCNRAVVTHLKAALVPEVQRHSREW